MITSTETTATIATVTPEKPRINAIPRAPRLPWVVVVSAGTTDQHIVKEAPTFAAAWRYRQGLKDATADVMKRLPNGLLTTEY